VPVVKSSCLLLSLVSDCCNADGLWAACCVWNLSPSVVTLSRSHAVSTPRLWLALGCRLLW